MSTPAQHTGRAVWFTAERRAELLEEDVAAPGPAEVRVRAIVSLVSAGTEMNVFRGQVASPTEVAIPNLGGGLPFPIKFAYQAVGRVEEAGADAGFAAGDLVFAQHPHQEMFTMATDGDFGDTTVPFVYPIPEGLAPDKAVFANLFSVAYGGLLDAPVRIGDIAVVSGLGVIGSFAASLARRTAGRLVLVDPLEERRERARWIGADAVVGPAEAPDVVAELSDGRGADVYFEASGAPAALQGAIDATGVEGVISVISYYGGREVKLRLSPEFHLRRQRIVSSFAGGFPGEIAARWSFQRRMQAAMEILGGMDTTPLVSHRLAFSDAPSAYPLIDEHPSETLGIILEY